MRAHVVKIDRHMITLKPTKPTKMTASLRCGFFDPAGLKCRPAKNIGAPQPLQTFVPNVVNGASAQVWSQQTRARRR
jgi:hypothetical protein